MKKNNYSFWIKSRHNPQLGVYYTAMGQMSNAAAKRAEKSLYGSNYMHEYKAEDEYLNKITELQLAGANVNKN